MFEVGKLYNTIGVGPVRIVAKEESVKNYETVRCRDGVHRYDRRGDYGRVTGSNHKIPDPKNLVPTSETSGELFKFRGYLRVVYVGGQVFADFVSLSGDGKTRVLTISDDCDGLKYVGTSPSTFIMKDMGDQGSYAPKIYKDFLIAFGDNIPKFGPVNDEEHFRYDNVIYVEMLDDHD